MKKSGFFTALAVSLLLALVLSGVSLLSSCYPSYRYSSNGERIYFTATSSSGQSITYSGSIRMMHSITWNKLTQTNHIIWKEELKW